MKKNCKTWNKAYLVVSSATMLSKFSPSAKQATIQGKNDLESAFKIFSIKMFWRTIFNDFIWHVIIMRFLSFKTSHYLNVKFIYDLFRPSNRSGDICNDFGSSMDRLDTQHWVYYKLFCTFYFHDSCYDTSTSLLPSYGSQSYQKVFIIYLNMIPIQSIIHFIHTCWKLRNAVIT